MQTIMNYSMTNKENQLNVALPSQLIYFELDLLLTIDWLGER